MIWDITPYQAAPVTHPSGPFAPQRSIVAYAVPDTLQCCVALPGRKALILHLPGRLGVGDRHGGGPIPIAREFICAKSVCRDGGCARRSYPPTLTSALVHAWFSPHHSLLVEKLPAHRHVQINRAAHWANNICKREPLHTKIAAKVSGAGKVMASAMAHAQRDLRPPVRGRDATRKQPDPRVPHGRNGRAIYSPKFSGKPLFGRPLGFLRAQAPGPIAGRTQR